MNFFFFWFTGMGWKRILRVFWRHISLLLLQIVVSVFWMDAKFLVVHMICFSLNNMHSFRFWTECSDYCYNCCSWIHSEEQMGNSKIRCPWPGSRKDCIRLNLLRVLLFSFVTYNKCNFILLYKQSIQLLIFFF